MGRGVGPNRIMRHEGPFVIWYAPVITLVAPAHLLSVLCAALRTGPREGACTGEERFMNWVPGHACTGRKPFLGVALRMRWTQT